MAELKLEHIYKVYPNGTKAVNDFSMDIKNGEFIVFVGPSGCGKSTTLRMIAGLEDITAGELYIDGEIVNDREAKDRDIAMVFQNYALYPHMTVYDNMAFGLKLHHVPNDIIAEKVLWAADILGIKEYLDRKPRNMSGGQRQRVALGRAILRDPKVMLLDEPLSNLDAKLRAQMRTEIAKLHQKLKTTFIYVTHDQSEAMALSDRIIIMNKGFISQIGSPKEVYYQPKNEFVADFIGEVNFIEGSVIDMDETNITVKADNHVINMKNQFNFKKDDEVKLVLRPEAAHLTDSGDIKVEVILSTFMGSYQLYHVKQGNNVVKITEYNPRNQRIFQVGETAYLFFDDADVHPLPSHEPIKVETIYLDC